VNCTSSLKSGILFTSNYVETYYENGRRVGDSNPPVFRYLLLGFIAFGVMGGGIGLGHYSWVHLLGNPGPYASMSTRCGELASESKARKRLGRIPGDVRSQWIDALANLSNDAENHGKVEKEFDVTFAKTMSLLFSKDDTFDAELSQKLVLRVRSLNEDDINEWFGAISPSCEESPSTMAVALRVVAHNELFDHEGDYRRGANAASKSRLLSRIRSLNPQVVSRWMDAVSKPNTTDIDAVFTIVICGEFFRDHQFVESEFANRLDKFRQRQSDSPQHTKDKSVPKTRD
jgi:hypothetical protein